MCESATKLLTFAIPLGCEGNIRMNDERTLFRAFI